MSLGMWVCSLLWMLVLTLAFCAALYASVTANANGWSDVEANAQLKAEPNAGLNAEVDALLIRLP